MLFKTYLRDILLVIGISVIMTGLITSRVFSQDTTKMKRDKKVRIVAKIVEDNNGKRQEFDTTINLDRKLKPGEEHDIMKSFRMRMKDLDDQMKELDNQMKDLESAFNDMKLPDSGMMDSVQRHLEKAFRRWGGTGNFHFRHDLNPWSNNYDYNFDFPEFDRHPQRFLKEFGGGNGHEKLGDEYQYRSKGEDKSLNDLLGDIPMDKVKSYTITDTKDGKRIVIELSKEPFIGQHREVIIIHPPRSGSFYREGQRPQIRKKVIIKEGSQKDDDDQDDL